MKAIWNGSVIAESNDTILIEGNQYFPEESINQKYLKESTLTTLCPWKGQANYYDIVVGEEENENAAWYYSQPKEGAIKIVADQNDGRGDFTNYIAFWNGVEVV